MGCLVSWGNEEGRITVDAHSEMRILETLLRMKELGFTIEEANFKSREPEGFKEISPEEDKKATKELRKKIKSCQFLVDLFSKE